MVFLRKIKSGRRAIVWKINGDAEYIDGPRLVVVWPCCNRIQPLMLHQANDMQYLEISYLDGRTEIQPGPAGIYDDPLKIASIVNKELIKLDANEVLILYTQGQNAEKQGKHQQTTFKISTNPFRSIVHTNNHQRSDTLRSET